MSQNAPRRFFIVVVLWESKQENILFGQAKNQSIQYHAYFRTVSTPALVRDDERAHKIYKHTTQKHKHNQTQTLSFSYNCYKQQSIIAFYIYKYKKTPTSHLLLHLKLTYKQY